MLCNKYNLVNDSDIEKLKVAVIKAQQFAYCPYSHFRVGCALLTTDDKIYTGCNVENAAYPAGICAERTALTKAVSEGYKTFKALAIITDSNDCASPCGVCRQFIREFADSNIIGEKKFQLPIIMFKNDASEHLIMTLDDLLPHSFGPGDLPK
jgi:cytidine deaminase